MKNDVIQNFEKDLIAYAERVGLPVSAMESMSQDLTVGQRTFIGKVYNNVIDTLNQASCYNSTMYNTQFAPDRSAMESMTATSFDEQKMGGMIDHLAELCETAKIPSKDRAETMRALYMTMYRYLNRTIGIEHWGNDQEAGNTRAMSELYPQAALSDVAFGNARPGQEAFGASIDTVLPDVRMAMTVILLKPHKGIMSRLIHRRTLAGSVITYVIHADEFYDLTKSQNQKGSVRNSFDHRLPIVSLYRRPDPINMTLVPIIPMKANDTDDKFLVADGVVKFGVNADLFDLSMDPTKIGYNNINWTDLVSDGVTLEGIYFTVENADASVVEQFYASTETLSHARLTMIPNTGDSGDRATQIKFRMPLTVDSTMLDGNASTLFASITGEDELIDAEFNVATSISLKTAVAQAIGSVTISARPTRAGVELSDTIKDLVEGAAAYKISLVGYKLDAKFSEENLRKVNMAVRTQTYTAMYELPQGKSIVVDFSMQQSVPEHVLNTAQEVQAIGIDHRNLQAFLKLMRHVHDQGKIEASDPNYREANNGRTLNTAFVSGQRVNPHVILGTIDLARVMNVRSSDMLGDVRQYVDSYLNKVISMLHLRSLYIQQLDNGEIPTYKVLTSGPIIENLLSVPHIHNHLHPNGMDGEKIFREKTPGEPIEFTRVLPSGVKLECISTPFEYMEDKIMIIPFRSSDPSSELNFAHNWDGGQFVANYTPVDQNQVNKRVYMNTREWPIPTCPIGILLTVRNLDKVLPDIVTVAP